MIIMKLRLKKITTQLLNSKSMITRNQIMKKLKTTMKSKKQWKK